MLETTCIQNNKGKRNDKKCIELFKTQSVPYHGAIETTNQDTIGVLNLKRLQCTINVLENLVHDRWLCCRLYRSYHLISLAAFASLPCLGCDCPFSILIEANLVIIFLFTANFTSNNLKKCKKQTNQAIKQCDLYIIYDFSKSCGMSRDIYQDMSKSSEQLPQHSIWIYRTTLTTLPTPCQGVLCLLQDIKHVHVLSQIMSNPKHDERRI